MGERIGLVGALYGNVKGGLVYYYMLIVDLLNAFKYILYQMYVWLEHLYEVNRFSANFSPFERRFIIKSK